MKTVRLIARLDAKGPNLVKGICLEGFRVLGLPEDFAAIYDAEGIDEVVYVDAVASLYRRRPRLDVIRRVAGRLSVPLTVIGGIGTVEDIRAVLASGADKVGINTAGIERPELFAEAAALFGSQCVVCSIEAFRHPDGRYECWTRTGRELTGIDPMDFATQAIRNGAGEILLTSIDREGTGRGFDIELTRRLSGLPVPVIACGGAGQPEHFFAAVHDGRADAVAAASVFHYKYARAVDRHYMSFDEPRLRAGRDIDAGNVQFLNWGYGGLRDLMVSPHSVAAVKEFLIARGIGVRPPFETAIQEDDIHPPAREA
ncbi:MAG: hypothetical protein OHK0024_12130 [Thalassobaculales bacterium]